MSRKPSALVQVLALFGWLGVTSLAAAFGSIFRPGQWYRELEKPAWTPPDEVFGPVWTILYILMALAAWLVWRKGGWKANQLPLSIYLVHLVLNGAWSWLFFGLQAPLLALVDILALIAAAGVTGFLFWRVSKVAGAAFVPYLLWLLYAAALNAAIVWMN